MSQEPLKATPKVQPEPLTQAQTADNRKAAKKTAIILGVVALGFFIWSVFIVLRHANG